MTDTLSANPRDGTVNAAYTFSANPHDGTVNMADTLSSNPYEPIFTAQKALSEPGQRAPANGGSTSSRAWSGWSARMRPSCRMR